MQDVYRLNMDKIHKIKIRQGMEHLYVSIKEILANARKRAYAAVNFAMVENQAFPKRDTLCPELTWSHYRRLISVEDEKASNSSPLAINSICLQKKNSSTC